MNELYGPSSSAFTPLATLHLPRPHVLHPQACNPTMDLVILLGSSGPVVPPTVKGKGRAMGGNTKLALWRMSGTKVWSVDIDGSVRGLAWTHDGLYLTILVVKAGPTSKPTLQHLSVHNGENVKSVHLNLEESPESAAWWDLSWTVGEHDWPKAAKGSAQMIIDSLPRVTPVEPPKAANAHPFMLPNAAKAKKSATTARHSRLDNFPSLLPTVVPSPPHVLSVSAPGSTSSTRLLTGTLPLGKGASVDTQLLKLAGTCERLSGFIDTILRGLEAVGDAFKEGEKQTMIWREELESCGDQQAMSHAEVHADLFTLLVTGRASVPVTEWLGNRLTGRTVTKWEQSLETSFKTIGKVFAESVAPPLERIILLLEEMRGWSKVPGYSHLGFEESAVEQVLDIASRFAKLVERMRQQAEEEMYAASEWIKWLRYEISRSVGQDTSTDTFHPCLCDIKLVWSFMKTTFVHSPLLVHFPSQFRARPPDDLLPLELETNPGPRIPQLAQVMQEFLEMWKESDKKEDILMTPSPTEGRQGPDESIDSNATHMSPIKNPWAGAGGKAGLDPSSPRETEMGTRSPSASIPSSPDTVAEKPVVEYVPEPRVLEKEPWVWANTLIAKLGELVKSRDVGMDESAGWSVSDDVLMDTHTASNGLRFTAVIAPTQTALYILVNDKQLGTRISLEGVTPLALSFFDDEELALLFQTSDGGRYLVAINYASIGFEQIEPMRGLQDLFDNEVAFTNPPHEIASLKCRFRHLKTVSHVEENELISMALNGRKGRRVGCISMGDCEEVEVLDMDEDEDGDGDEEEEGDVEMSDVVEE